MFFKAINNLIVLARESDGANEIVANNGLKTLSNLLDHNEASTRLGVIRILSCMTKNSFKRVSLDFDKLITVIEIIFNLLFSSHLQSTMK
jgi:hypothetical protein